MVVVRVAEWIVSVSLVFGPPTGEVSEGPAEAEAPVETEAPVEREAAGEPGTRDVDAVVESAAQAVKDRAWLERNKQEIPEYVRQLDALADVAGELDTCAGAIRAELRMALALAYLKQVGTCGESGELGEDTEAADTSAELPMPVLECYEASGPAACADRLLEHVAEFAEQGPGGIAAPFAAAFGCSHAVAEMSVEQMFGACMVEQYDAAVERWTGRPADVGEEPVNVWPVPRWASITGVSVGAVMVISGAVLLGINGKCPGGHDPVSEAEQCPSVYNTDVGGGVLVGIGAISMLGMGTVLVITEPQRKKAGEHRPTALRRRLDRAEALTGLRLSLPRPRLRLRP